MKRWALLAAIAGLSLVHGESVPQERLEARRAFSELKFGIFVHWGLYASFAQGEWYLEQGGLDESEYAKAANAFYPHAFDAREWARSFKSAGAKYVVFTTRHHDGFSMFDTKATDYDVVDATPFRRDVVRELADACREEGLKLGFYYSLMDWHRPDYPTGREKKARASVTKGQEDYNSYLEFMKSQLTELLTNYGDVLCVWFDGEWDHDPNDVNSKGLTVPTLDWRFDELYALVHRLQPKCLILNNHHHAMRDGEDIQGFERDAPGENKAGLSPGQKVEREFPLETCDTMTKGAWGYQVGVTDYKSPAEIRALLESTNGKGANLLLNVGPQPDGSLPARAVEVLSELVDEDGTCPVSVNVHGHENVEWSTAYAFGLTDATKGLPRVLLVGDSICMGYQEGVRQRLKGKMNVSYWVSSYCATSAAYLPLLSVYLDEAKYDVIHFNNGLHSLSTPTDAWAKGFKAAMELVRRKQPGAKVVWCSSTPLKDAAKTAKCRELNAAAAQVVEELGGVGTNDLFALLDPLDREENWRDVCHHKPALCAKESEQVAAAVLSARPAAAD